MNIALLVILFLILLAIIELFVHIKLIKKIKKPLTYVWLGVCLVALVIYFRSLDFDFALLLVLATFIAGIVALLDNVFLRKKRLENVIIDDPSNKSAQIKEPLIVEYSRSFFPVLLLVLILRSFIFEPFRIPSGSMYPGLEIGDFIVVSKFSYGLRLPVSNSKIIPIAEPQKGDVVVFKFPLDKRINYIKRIVGLPGDKIRYFDKQLFINDVPQAIEYKGKFSYRESGRVNTLNLLTENLGEAQHDILLADPGFSAIDNGEWTVPEGSYFVMGDNRDKSSDSRYWGFMPEENLVGKAKYVWMHIDFAGNGFKFSRIGTKID